MDVIIFFIALNGLGNLLLLILLDDLIKELKKGKRTIYKELINCKFGIRNNDNKL